MKEGGYIKLSRAVLEDEFFNEGKPFTKKEALMYLVEKARYSKEPKKVMFNNKEWTINRGELVTSTRVLKREWRWGSHNTVKRFLNTLEELTSLVTKTDQDGVHLNLCGIVLYESTRTSDGPATDQRRTTNSNKENKRIKEIEKINKKEIPKNEHLPDQPTTNQDPTRYQQAAKEMKAYLRENLDQLKAMIENAGYAQGGKNALAEVDNFWSHHCDNEFMLRNPIKYLGKFQFWLKKSKQFSPKRTNKEPNQPQAIYVPLEKKSRPESKPERTPEEQVAINELIKREREKHRKLAEKYSRKHAAEERNRGRKMIAV